MGSESARPNSSNPAPVIFVAAFAAFLATFNETFLNIAYTPIMAEFGVSINTVQWLSTGYLLGAAVMVPITSFFYRRFSTRALFLSTVAFILVGSAAAALAPSFSILLLGRVIQAIGTGMMIPTGMNLTLAVSPREKIGRNMGIMGAMTTLGPSAAVIFSGLLLEIAPWRVAIWFFFALAAICFVTALAVLKDVSPHLQPRLDVTSVALISVGLVGVLFGISTVMGGRVLLAAASIIVGIAALALFTSRQLKIDTPLLDISTLRNRIFALGVLINMAAIIMIFALNIILPIFLQSTQGRSPLQAALALAPAIVLSAVVSPIAGKVFDKHGIKRLVPTGLALMTIFSVAVAFAAPMNAPLTLIAVLYIPIIAASALVIGPIQSHALSQLSHAQNPDGVTVISTGFQVAGAIGSSLFVGIYYAIMGSRATAGVQAPLAAGEGFRVATLAVALIGAIGFALSLAIQYVQTRSKTHAADLSGAPTATADSFLSSIMDSEVYTVKDDATVFDALSLFVERKVSGAPVINGDGAMVGFISDGDIMRYFGERAPMFTNVYSLAYHADDRNFDESMTKLMASPVHQLSRTNVVSVPLDATVSELYEVFSEHHVKKLPIVDGDRLVGVVNRSNLNRYLLQRYLTKVNAAEAADDNRI